MSNSSRRLFLAGGVGGIIGTRLPFTTAHADDNGSIRVDPNRVLQDPELLDRTVLQNMINSYSDEANDYLYSNGLPRTYDDDINGPWEMLLARFSRYVSGGGANDEPKQGDSFNGNVQMVTVPTAATWDDAKYGPFRLCKVLGDTMPKWRPIYDTTGGNSLGDAYGLFVQSIAIPAPTPSQQQEIEAARLKWQVALDKVQKREAGVGGRWDTFDRRQQNIPQDRRLSFDQYVAKYETPVLNSMRSALNSYQQVFIQKINLYTKGYGLVADIIARFGGATFLTPTEGAGDDIPQLVYRYNIDQDLGDFKKRAAAEKSDAVAWDFTKDSFRLHASETRWGGSASYGGFFSGSASGGTSHLDWHSADFRLSFKANAIERFRISPDSWYSATLIKLFKNGDFVPGSIIDKAWRAGSLWGKGGLMALRTATLVLVYNPSIEIYMAKADYDRTSSWWSGSASIGIGPFSFGANAGGSKTDISFDTASNSIRAHDTTGIPKILAVSDDVFPDFS